MKKFLGLFLAVCLAGCQTAAPAPEETIDNTPAVETAYAETADAEFSAWLDDYVKEECESDYTTMHQFFEHPEAYGMDVEKADITLGTYLPTKEDEEELADFEKGLAKFDREKLDKTQQEIYDQLAWQLDITKESYKEENLYLGCIWGVLNNPADDLVTYFSEYEIRDEEDIEPLIELIEDVPNYFDSAVEFSKGQAEHGTLVMDYDYIMDKCQDVVNTQNDSAVTENLMKEIDELDLEDGDAYKEKVRKALDASFFPAYQDLMQALPALSQDSEPIQPVTAFKGGKDYYALVLKNATGTDITPDEMETQLSTAIYGLSTKLNKMLEKNPKLYDKVEAYKTSFKSPEAIMEFLADHYKEQFPATGPFRYELQPLAKEQSNPNTVAYFMIPPVDNTAPYRIRYNKQDYGDDTTSLDFYETMAHEGIPGHMYQTQYDSETFEYLVQYLLSNLGFTEGYATYVQSCSLDFLDMEDDVREAWILMNRINNYYVALMDIQANWHAMSEEEFQETFGDPMGQDMSDTYELLVENPAQMVSYYYGDLAIQQLRTKAEKELGDKFEPVGFNNALLEAGKVNFEIITRNVDAWIEAEK